MVEQVLSRAEKILHETPTPYLVAEEREVLARFLARLERECGDAIRRVILYGSKARGDADAESDTDVLVVVADDATRVKIQGITREASFCELKGFSFSWRILTEAEYAEYRRLLFPFYVNLRRDGIELWNPAASLIEEFEYPLDFQEGVSRPMTPETIALIRRYVEEAQSEWQAVEKLRAEMPLFAIPHAYYAAFYMATAALYAVSVVRNKHAGVRDGLSEFLVKPKLLEESYKDIYTRLMNARVNVNYRPFQDEDKIPTDDEAREMLRDAERFIARLERFLRERGAIE
jgi:uncharacterized protein (UPF0332 family)/predicted nucleotidyltransferase